MLSALLLRGVSAQSVSDTELLDIGRAGQFQVGMSVDDVVNLVGQNHVRLIATYPEGRFQPVVEISLPSLDNVVALIAPIREWPCPEFSIWGIRVLDPSFKTRERIGVGSTLSELRQAYPSEIRVGTEGGQPMVHIARLGLTFAFSHAPEIGDGAPIEFVWVVPQPVSVRANRCPDQGLFQ
ncbi:MAG: hypothetical protein RQ757_01400 [Pseudomonadales bacterium]|nr:hypothetical protein [Pseudomonadales bacterium]